MMKNLRASIMIDVQEVMNENMKVLMIEMTVIIRNSIFNTMKTQTTFNIQRKN